MEPHKLNHELHEIEALNSDDSDYYARDPSNSSSSKDTEMEMKTNIMQVENKGKYALRKFKSVKSKDKQIKDNSKKLGSSRKRTRLNDLYDDVEAKYYVLEQAWRVLASLGNELPYFLKCMLPSNVSHGFWLHLPKYFWSIHLPKHDTSIVLVDEWGNEYKTTYLLDRHGLSAGWRGFSISHKLLKGDILIFQLTAPCKLKVHIVRVNSAVDAALCLLNMYASGRVLNNGDRAKKDDGKRKKTKYVEPYLMDDANGKKTTNATNSALGPEADHN